MSAIFFHNAAQGELALASKERYEAEKGQRVFTEISRLDRFYWAEDYHQKYSLRRYRMLAEEMKNHYPRLEDFVNSTATARINGYLSGYGDFAHLTAEIQDYGLSEAGQQTLLDVMAQFQNYGR